MNTRFATIALAALLIAACQRSPAPADLEADRRREEQLRQMDEKLARLQDLEQQAIDRKLAESEQRVTTSDQARRQAEQERQKAERERIALQKERDQLAMGQKDAEARAREAERVAAETAKRAEQDRSERTIDLFYTALQPQGDWFEVDRYGYVWQPAAAADPRWRPYTDGHWVFTEYGWFWKSNEAFGWAAYHYGRWARLRNIGWVWVPGTEWGPAWVAWRRSDRYVGWAPLPPDAWSGSGFTAAVDSYYDIGPGSYTFVPVEQVGEPTYVGHVVAPEQNVTIVNQTVNVTNITYTKIQNNTVIYNAGPDITVVNARAAKKVPQLKVERVTKVGDTKELGRSEQRGDTLVVNSPNLGKAKATERPQRVKEAVKAPEVEKGWSNLDKSASDQARQKIKAEATESEEQQRRPIAKPIRPVELPPAAVAQPKPPQPVKAEPVDTKPNAEPAAAVERKPAKVPAVVPRVPKERPVATPLPEPAPADRPLNAKPGRPAAEPVNPLEAPATQPGKPDAAEKPAVPPVDVVGQKAEKGNRARQGAATPRPAQPLPTDIPAASPSEPTPATAPEATPPTRKLPKALKNRPDGAGAPPAADAPAQPAAEPAPEGRKRERGEK